MFSKFLQLLEPLTGPPPKRRPPPKNLEAVPTGWKRSLIAFGIAGGYGLILMFGTADQVLMLNRVVESLQAKTCDAPEDPGPDQALPAVPSPSAP